MTLDELIQRGWADHDSQTPEVADRLEQNVGLVADGNGAAQLMNLAIHTVGDHGKDRSRARRICEAALERAGDDPGEAPFLYLAVARHLDDDDEGAMEARLRLGDDPAVPVRVDMLVAQGRMHAGEWDRAASLYEDALSRAEALPSGHRGERATAVVSNNLASELLEKNARTAGQDDLMERAAQAAKTFWTRVGTWENTERGDYLLALVHHALGRHDEARAFAESGLATIAANGEEKVDEAFLHLARARACRDAGDAAEQAASLAKAGALAAAFEADGLRSWFAKERAKSEGAARPSPGGEDGEAPGSSSS